MSILDKARQFAQDKHKNHIDDEGMPYFDAHLEQVVNILQQVTADEELLAAAYLHDTIEDTETTYEELVAEFGSSIVDLVMELTQEGQKHQGHYFPRLHSEKAIMIKFADRLSNLSRMNAWHKRRRLNYLKRSKFWRSEKN